MDKKKQIIMFIAGGIALLVLIPVLVFSFKALKNRASRQEERAVSGAATDSAAGSGVPTKRRAKKSQFTSWGRNPFAPAEVGRIKSEVMLSGIMWNEEAPQAIINNEIVEVGDKIGGRTVVDIQKDRVIIDDGSGKVEIRLWQNL